MNRKEISVGESPFVVDSIRLIRVEKWWEYIKFKWKKKLHLCQKKITKKIGNWVDIAFKRKKGVWKEKMWNKHLVLRETSWDGEYEDKLIICTLEFSFGYDFSILVLKTVGKLGVIGLVICVFI